MAEPNDDMHAFGWDLGRLRYPSADSKPNDIWPGPPMFGAPEAKQLLNGYHFDVQFVCPKYVQMLLDIDPDVRIAAEKTRDAGYTKEALDDFNKVIQTAFFKKVVPRIIKNFNNMSIAVAQFYAARLAHIDKFGNDDYIDASTIKSRR